MTWRQRDGRHIRQRTVEVTSESLQDAIEEMHFMLQQRRWSTAWLSTVRFPRAKTTWPLPAWLAAELSKAVHFLCLLRGRLGIVPDVWTRVVLEVLPCVRRFGYTRSSSSTLPWAECMALPLLPGER